MNNFKKLDLFIKKLNSYQIIIQQPFLTLYPDFFKKSSTDLKEVIYKKIVSINIDTLMYLKLSKDKIEKNVQYLKSDNYLESWIKKYELFDIVFPFTKNEKIQLILASDIKSVYLDYSLKKEYKNIQIDFFCYAAMIEKYEMISFLEENIKLIEEKEISIKNTDTHNLNEKISDTNLSNSFKNKTSIDSKKTNDIKTTKIPAKYHALAYMLELVSNNTKPPQDYDGNFKKEEIIKIGRERCDDTGQSFYNFVKDNFQSVTKNEIKNSIFKNWKNFIVNVSQNKEKVEEYIKKNNL